MQPTPEPQTPDPAAQFFAQLEDFLEHLALRLDVLEQQMRRVEINSDNAARELAEISREQWINRSIAQNNR